MATYDWWNFYEFLLYEYVLLLSMLRDMNVHETNWSQDQVGRMLNYQNYVTPTGMTVAAHVSSIEARDISWRSWIHAVDWNLDRRVC